jgi:hypothetical protein
MRSLLAVLLLVSCATTQRKVDFLPDPAPEAGSLHVCRVEKDGNLACITLEQFMAAVLERRAKIQKQNTTEL